MHLFPEISTAKLIKIQSFMGILFLSCHAFIPFKNSIYINNDKHFFSYAAYYVLRIYKNILSEFFRYKQLILHNTAL